MQTQMSGNPEDDFSPGDYLFNDEALKNARRRVRELEHKAKVSF